MEKKTFKVPANEVGNVVKTKSGRLALKVSQDITLKAGEYVMLEKPEDRIAGLVAKGFITEEQGDERKARTPDWIRYNATRIADKKTDTEF